MFQKYRYLIPENGDVLLMSTINDDDVQIDF